MSTLRKSLILLVLACLSGVAFARSGVPIVNLEHNPIPAKAGRTLDDVARAITLAGQDAGRWSVSDRAPGRMKLTVSSRKHTAVVELTFDTQSYSIRYVDSSNLGYKKSGSEELIHPHYNGWVEKLKQHIDRQLL